MIDQYKKEYTLEDMVELIEELIHRDWCDENDPIIRTYPASGTMTSFLKEVKSNKDLNSKTYKA